MFRKNGNGTATGIVHFGISNYLKKNGVNIKSLQYAVLVLVLILASRSGIAQPTNVLDESRPDLFTFFNPLAANIPAGSATASKGVIFINSYNESLNRFTGTSGSAFLIWTNRDDNKICMCLTGHQIKELYPDSEPIVGGTIRFNSNITTDYLGYDSLDGGVNYTAVKKGYATSFISTAQLVAYSFDPAAGGVDMAMLLINPSDLTSSNPSLLGYDFRNVTSANEICYSLAYPLKYPQRILDSLRFVSSNDNVVEMSTRLPYGGAPGASGAPLITSFGSVSGFGTVKGILARGVNDVPFPSRIRGRSNTITASYALNSRYTKMSLLEPAIRRHCWKKTDSAAISLNNLYKQTVTVDNKDRTASYSHDFRLNGVSNLTSVSASVFSELSSDNLQLTRLNANLCNISGFTLPVNDPETNKPWLVTVAAKQIDVSGFEYTASGQAEMNLASIMIDIASSTQRLAQSEVQSEQIFQNGDFNLYPNPSPSGTFEVLSPATENFRIEVFTMDGRNVYRSRTNGAVTHLELSNLSRGHYVLAIYNNQGKAVFKQVLIY